MGRTDLRPHPARFRFAHADLGQAGRASGTAYLQSKLAARTADEEHHADLGQMCDQVHAELCTIALAYRLGIPQRREVSGHQRPMLLNGFYLVRNDQHQRFGALVAELNDGLGHQGIELKLTGPWAPYNFVTSGGRRRAMTAIAVQAREVAIIDLLDRLLAGGVVIQGQITLCAAGVDLVQLDMRVVVATIDKLAGRM